MIYCFQRMLRHQPFMPMIKFSLSIHSDKIKSVEFHQAVLATRIIKLIKHNAFDQYFMDEFHTKQMKKKTENSNISSELMKNEDSDSPASFSVYPSLKSRIINLIESYSDSIIESSESHAIETAKKRLLSYFREGVWLHPAYCSQQRFEELELKFSQIDKEKEIIDNSFVNQNEFTKYRKITFCPTYFTTTQVFLHILNLNKYILLTGHFGIGKTYSFILYRVLSDMIFQFKHKFKIEYKDRPTEIDFDIPKLIYWSVDIKKDYEKEIEKIILGQCYEIPDKFEELKATEEYKEEYFGIFDKKKQKKLTISSIYDYLDIKPILMVDQISTIASAIRKYDNLLKSQEEKLSQEKEKGNETISSAVKNSSLGSNIMIERTQEEMQKEEIITDAENAYKLLFLKELLRYQFKKVLYLSSQTIERYLLKQLNLTGYHSHYPITIAHLEYRKYLDLPPTISDIVEFIVYQINRNISERNLEDLCIYDQENSQETPRSLMNCSRIILFELLKENKIMIPYWTIYKKINFPFQLSGSNNLIIDNLLKSKTEKELKEHLESIITELSLGYLNDLKKNVREFLEKQTHIETKKELKKLKSILLFKLLNAAKSQKKEKLDNPKMEKYSVLNIKIENYIKSSQTSTQQIKDLENEISEFLDNNLFRYHEIYGFTCLLHEDVVIEILESLENDLLKVLIEENVNLWHLIDSPNGKGLLLESIFRKNLSIEGTNLYFKDPINQSEVISFRNMNIHHLNHFFLSIPKISEENYSRFYFLKHFEKEFKHFSSGLYYLYPRKCDLYNKEGEISIKENLIDHSSKSIDFIIYNKITNFIEISAFDTTISKDNYWEKISKFLAEFVNFKDKHQLFINNLSVSLNYVIICPYGGSKEFDWSGELTKYIKKLEAEKEKQKVECLKKITLIKESNSKITIKYQDGHVMFLKSIYVVSFLGAQFTNDKNPERISLTSKLLETIKKEFGEVPI